MQVRTSTDWPRARGSGRRTTRRKVTSVSPLGSSRSSAGEDTRPRSTTSFRSMTATLMRAASSPRGARTRPGHRLWTAGPGVDPARAGCRRSVLLAVLRRIDFAEELRDLGLDVLAEVEVVDRRRLVLLQVRRIAVTVLVMPRSGGVDRKSTRL